MRDKTPTKITLYIVTALVALGTTTGLVWVRQAEKQTAANTAIAAATKEQTAKTKGAHTTHLSYVGVQGKTALELLKQHAAVAIKDSSYGPYVDSINGLVGGTDGKYWAFYVNGKLAEVGANAYITQSADQIEWKFE